MARNSPRVSISRGGIVTELSIFAGPMSRRIRSSRKLRKPKCSAKSPTDNCLSWPALTLGLYRSAKGVRNTQTLFVSPKNCHRLVNSSAPGLLARPIAIVLSPTVRPVRHKFLTSGATPPIRGACSKTALSRLRTTVANLQRARRFLYPRQILLTESSSPAQVRILQAHRITNNNLEDRGAAARSADESRFQMVPDYCPRHGERRVGAFAHVSHARERRYA